jgi:hypothetical protein
MCARARMCGRVFVCGVQVRACACARVVLLIQNATLRHISSCDIYVSAIFFDIIT